MQNSGDTKDQVVRQSLGNVQAHAAKQAEKRMSPAKNIKSKVAGNMKTQKIVKKEVAHEKDLRRSINKETMVNVASI